MLEARKFRCLKRRKSSIGVEVRSSMSTKIPRGRVATDERGTQAPGCVQPAAWMTESP